jgi:hypothetical protein
VKTPDAVGLAAQGDGSEIPMEQNTDGLEAAAPETGLSAPLLLSPVKNNGEQPDPGDGPLFSDPPTAARTQETDVSSKKIDGPPPDPDRLRFVGEGSAPRSHIFWSPFRREWAANGFARRLTDATQINIDVIEVKRGSYRAAFNYQDESQRLEHMDRIESITGLQLE